MGLAMDVTKDNLRREREDRQRRIDALLEEFPDVHPAIVNALLFLPKAGEPFPAAKRKSFLRAMWSLFELVYGDVGPVSIEIESTGQPSLKNETFPSKG